MVAIALLPATVWAEGTQLNGRPSLIELLFTDAATPPSIGIPIAGLPEPSPDDTAKAYYRRCMGVNSRAGGGSEDWKALCYRPRVSSNALASCRSAVSNPSVNQP